MKLHPFLLTLTLFCAGAASRASARNIDWGGGVGDSLFDSTGATLTSSFIFEVGSFGSVFTPLESNMDQWLTNWKVFDRATEGSGWNSGDQFFTGSANLNTDGTSTESPPLPSYTFAQGEQGYIWTYKTDQTYAPGLEWALITNDSSDGNIADNWTFPVHSDQTSLPLQWNLVTASTPVFGGLNNVPGPGVRSSNPPQVDLQTHTIAPIPEPGSALLLGLGVIPFLRRRRK